MFRRITLVSLVGVPAVTLLVAGCGGGGAATAHGSASSSGSGQASTSSGYGHSSGSAGGGSMPKMAGMSGGGAGATAASPVPTGGEVVNLTADPGGQLRFTSARVNVARPGQVTLVMHNPASAGMSHGIGIEGPGVDRDGPVVSPNGTARLTVTLRAGTYTFYCPVPGHRQAGMSGTLRVG